MGPKGRETLCDECGKRFSNGKTGPRSATYDAEEAQDTLGYQVRFTDALQTKIDELHALARQVDPVAADAIKNRQAT